MARHRLPHPGVDQSTGELLLQPALWPPILETQGWQWNSTTQSAGNQDARKGFSLYPFRLARPSGLPPAQRAGKKLIGSAYPCIWVGIRAGRRWHCNVPRAPGSVAEPLSVSTLETLQDRSARHTLLSHGCIRWARDLTLEGTTPPNASLGSPRMTGHVWVIPCLYPEPPDLPQQIRNLPLGTLLGRNATAPSGALKRTDEEFDGISPRLRAPGV